jgi:hypothetical protein
MSSSGNTILLQALSGELEKQQSRVVNFYKFYERSEEKPIIPSSHLPSPASTAALEKLEKEEDRKVHPPEKAVPFATTNLIDSFFYSAARVFGISDNRTDIETYCKAQKDAIRNVRELFYVDPTDTTCDIMLWSLLNYSRVHIWGGNPDDPSEPKRKKFYFSLPDDDQDLAQDLIVVLAETTQSASQFTYLEPQQLPVIKGQSTASGEPPSKMPRIDFNLLPTIVPTDKMLELQNRLNDLKRDMLFIKSQMKSLENRPYPRPGHVSLYTEDSNTDCPS